MNQLAEFGGIMFALMIVHAIGDWIFQWQWMAENKVKKWEVRFWHCAIYSTCFIPIAVLLNMSSIEFRIMFWYIFITHFLIDSYKPLYWFRKLGRDKRADTWETFKEAFNTPDGFYLLVTLDQIFHLLSLIPVGIWMVMNK